VEDLKSLLLWGQSDTFGLFSAFFWLNVGLRERERENECVYALVGEEETLWTCSTWFLNQHKWNVWDRK